MENKKAEEESSNLLNKEKEDVVKSALAAAFSKYVEKSENKKLKLSDDKDDTKTPSKKSKKGS